MKPDEAFVRRLQDYDKELDLVWCERHPKNPKQPCNRWQIVRKHPDGRPRHVTFIVTEDGGYRPPGDDVLEALKKADSWRFGGSRLEHFRCDEFMAAVGMKSEEKARLDELAEQRYHGWTEELAARLEFAAKKDPHSLPDRPDRGDLLKLEKRIEAQKEVDAAYAVGKGEVVYDREIGGPRLVG